MGSSIFGRWHAKDCRFFQRCLWIEHIHSYRIHCYDWEDPPVGAQPFLSSGLAQLWWSLRWILERTLEQIEKSEMWQVWGYPLVNIQKAIENSHRNSWLSHKNGDFPVRYVNVYQRVIIRKILEQTLPSLLRLRCPVGPDFETHIP